MRVLAIILGLALPLLACAEGSPTEKFKEGEHYTVIAGQPAPSKTGPVEVVEMFWYGCGHCYQFESVVGPWKAELPEDVKFVGSPAVWRPHMEAHAKIYYAAKAMGALDVLHPVFFDVLNKAPNKAQTLVKPAEISALVSKHGVDGEKFVKTMESFAVNSQVQLGVSRQKAYKVSSTPEMVVAGYYMVTATKAGGHKGMIDVVDFLIEKLRKQRTGK